jgi:hypothetical protein
VLIMLPAEAAGARAAPSSFAQARPGQDFCRLADNEALNTIRPGFQRGFTLGQQFRSVVNASNVATHPRSMVHRQLDHVGADAEIGQPGDESSS